MNQIISKIYISCILFLLFIIISILLYGIPHFEYENK